MSETGPGGYDDVITIGLSDVYAARERISGHVQRTPMQSTATLSKLTNTTLLLKPESLQKTGSYKVRGAINAVQLLTPAERAAGVVTFSAGNAGAGIAYAAALMGVRCRVFMAKNAMPSKVEAIRAYGAEIHFGESIQDAFDSLERYRDETGARFISPFADPEIIAGQGTVGLEIIEDVPDVEQVIVGIGGGGLASGVALAIKSLKPEVRIVGVEPVGAPTLHDSLKVGGPKRPDKIETIADGLAAPFTMPLNYAIIEKYVDDVVLVTDDEIVEAMKLIMTRCKLVVEPAGAAATAALLTGKAGVPHGAKTVSIISGGNVDLGRLKGLL